MWFWIALMTFFLIVFLLTWAAARSQGDMHHLGLQHGSGISGSGGGDLGDGGIAGGAAGGTGWGWGGDGGGGDGGGG
jgi:hypothetical protein